MFFLIYLSKQIKYSSPRNYSLELKPGYYQVSMKGASGGHACNNGKRTSAMGGRGAKFVGILHISGVHKYIVTVGDTPAADCDAHYNPGAIYGLGGKSGWDDDKDSEQGGGGGGYTSIYRVDDDKIIAMMGGGSGASYDTNGGDAGGVGFSYGYDWDSGEPKKCIDCWSHQYHQGGNGGNHNWISGSGGGGGYYGGQGGNGAKYCDECTIGFGGSSYYDESFWTDYSLTPGVLHFEWETPGYFIYEILALCPPNCADCPRDNSDKCNSCMNGYKYYDHQCFQSCRQTLDPTYELNGICYRCPADCATCSNNKCTTCPQGKVLWNGHCVPPATPKASPRPSPEITPNITPSITPNETPYITPSITPSETPYITPSITPSETPYITPSITPSETPYITPSITPSETPYITPSITPSDTPSITPSITPSDTPYITPSITPSETPYITPSITPSETPYITPSITPNETPFDTPSITPYDTPSSTPLITPEDTSSKTPFDTPSETPYATVSMTPRATDDINEKGGSFIRNKQPGKSKKLSLGYIIAIIIGSIVLFCLIIVEIYFIASRNKNDENSSHYSNEMIEETVICDTTTSAIGTTLDNPMFSTTVDMDSDDLFNRDFQESEIENYFGVNTVYM